MAHTNHVESGFIIPVFRRPAQTVDDSQPDFKQLQGSFFDFLFKMNIIIFDLFPIGDLPIVKVFFGQGRVDPGFEQNWVEGFD